MSSMRERRGRPDHVRRKFGNGDTANGVTRCLTLILRHRVAILAPRGEEREG